MNAHSEYKSAMTKRFWEYKELAFGPNSGHFEEETLRGNRPPVFLNSSAHLNVLTRPGATDTECSSLLSQVPVKERHKWFRSMSSSQALALSVFGNLQNTGHLELLKGLKCEDGYPFSIEEDLPHSSVVLEHSVRTLGEPRPTSIDVMLSGRSSQVLIECKLTEPEVGTCSRPRLRQNDSAYQEQWCDGNYRQQMRRTERCPLTELGVQYWRYIPEYFRWNPDADLVPCPLNKNYQLVRNVLALRSIHERTMSLQSGHVVLVYDDRNPAFQNGGEGFIAFERTSENLIKKSLLRKCSWRTFIAHLQKSDIVSWLTDALNKKYGL